MEAGPKTNTFNSEGRILQVEYAIKNVSKGGTMIGIQCSDAIILFGITSGSEKIYKLDENVYAITCGLFSDTMQLITYARVKAQDYLEEYEQRMSVYALCRTVGKMKQHFTQINSRPFGVSMLYAGFDKDEPVLYSTDPSGTVTRWAARCYGKDHEAINTALKNQMGEMDVESGVRLLFSVIKKNVEIESKDLDKCEMLLLRRDGAKFVGVEEMKKYFEESQ